MTTTTPEAARAMLADIDRHPPSETIANDYSRGHVAAMESVRAFLAAYAELAEEKHARMLRKVNGDEPNSVALMIENARLREALVGMSKTCRCRGTGQWETSCTLCGDSTYDHVCNDRTVPCDRPWCIAARNALAASGARTAQTRNKT